MNAQNYAIGLVVYKSLVYSCLSIDTKYSDMLFQLMLVTL